MMSVRSVVPIALVGVGILGIVGCNRDRDRADRERALDRPGTTGEQQPSTMQDQPGTTTITGANVVSNQTAVDRIVSARCAREAACNNVGADKKHVSEQACTTKIKADMKEDLNPKECPRGIDQKELNECLAEIKNENCNNPIDTIGRLAACRTSDLCLSTEAPNR